LPFNSAKAVFGELSENRQKLYNDTIGRESKDLLNLKLFARWNSESVARGYVEEFLRQKVLH
jgi:hypothetical protein